MDIPECGRDGIFDDALNAHERWRLISIQIVCEWYEEEGLTGFRIGLGESESVFFLLSWGGALLFFVCVNYIFDVLVNFSSVNFFLFLNFSGFVLIFFCFFSKFPVFFKVFIFCKILYSLQNFQFFLSFRFFAKFQFFF